MSNVTAIRPLVMQPSVEVEDRWLSPAEVCELVPGMTTDKLRDMRYRGIGPRFYKPSRKTVVYLASEVNDYVKSTTPTHWRAG